MDLDSLLAPLDWGRSALTNFGQGAVGLLGGDFTQDNIARLGPGLAGLVAGGLTGGLAGPAVGALVASLLQGGLQSVDPTGRAKSTGELLQALGGDPDSDLQNLGLGLVTDPWTYVGAGLAGRGGAKLATKLAGRGAVAEAPMLKALAREAPAAIDEVSRVPAMLDPLRGHPALRLPPLFDPLESDALFGALHAKNPMTESVLSKAMRLGTDEAVLRNRLDKWPSPTLRSWQRGGLAAGDAF